MDGWDALHWLRRLLRRRTWDLLLFVAIIMGGLLYWRSPETVDRAIEWGSKSLVSRSQAEAQRRFEAGFAGLSVGPLNGGFDTGDLTFWKPSGTVTVVTGSAKDGAYSAQLGSPTGSKGDSSIAQTFTAPTTSTTFSVWYKPTCPDPLTEGWVTITLRDHATGVTTQLPPTCATDGYRQVSGPVIAGRSYTLTITNHDDGVPGEATVTYVDSMRAH